MDNSYVAQLYSADHKISNRVVIEQFLLPKLGIKQTSQVTLPRDLKNGEELAKQISNEYDVRVKDYEEKFALRKFAFSPKKMVDKAIKHKQKILLNVFNELVYKDESYLELISWGQVVGLLGFEYEVRPSLRETILFGDPDLKEELKRLMQFRGIIYKDAKKEFTDQTPIQVMLYPEELNPRYVEEIGRLSGYPECCINAYMEDRKKGDNPKVRAVLDYYEACKEGKKPDPWAYFTSEFVPCRPDCHAAQSKGKNAHRLLGEVSAEIAADYLELVTENARAFEEEGKALKARIRKLQKETPKK